MFGTFEAERRDVKIVYGLVDQPQFFNPLKHQVELVDKPQSFNPLKHQVGQRILKCRVDQPLSRPGGCLTFSTEQGYHLNVILSFISVILYNTY
jgi:hypothetical protein